MSATPTRTPPGPGTRLSSNVGQRLGLPALAIGALCAAGCAGAETKGDDDLGSSRGATVTTSRPDGGGFQVVVQREIDTSADRVWEILGHGFADIAEWATLVERSRPLTVEEVPSDITLADDAPIVGRLAVTGLGDTMEAFTRFDDEARTFVFRGFNLPPVIESSQNTTEVTALEPSRSLVSFTVHLIFAGPFGALNGFMEDRMGKQFTDLQHDLKVYAETGEVSQRKRESLQ